MSERKTTWQKLLEIEEEKNVQEAKRMRESHLARNKKSLREINATNTIAKIPQKYYFFQNKKEVAINEDFNSILSIQRPEALKRITNALNYLENTNIVAIGFLQIYGYIVGYTLTQETNGPPFHKHDELAPGLLLLYTTIFDEYLNMGYCYPLVYNSLLAIGFYLPFFEIILSIGLTMKNNPRPVLCECYSSAAIDASKKIHMTVYTEHGAMETQNCSASNAPSLFHLINKEPTVP